MFPSSSTIYFARWRFQAVATVAISSSCESSIYHLHQQDSSIASSRRSKSNSPASTKPLPASSASKPTLNATKPPSLKLPSKANSPKNGASSIPTSSPPANSSNASSPNDEQNGIEREITENPPCRTPPFFRYCRTTG